MSLTDFAHPCATRIPFRNDLRTVPAMIALATFLEYRSAPDNCRTQCLNGTTSCAAPFMAPSASLPAAVVPRSSRLGFEGDDVRAEDIIQRRDVRCERLARSVRWNEVRRPTCLLQHLRNLCVNDVQVVQRRGGDVRDGVIVRRSTARKCETHKHGAIPFQSAARAATV